MYDKDIKGYDKDMRLPHLPPIDSMSVTKSPWASLGMTPTAQVLN